MSLESVQARIAEIQARIQALSPQTFDPPVLLPGVQPAQPLPDGSPGVQPFNVALATATGKAVIRPLSGSNLPKYDELIRKYSALYGVDPNLVRAVIKVESDGNPDTISKKGAMGLMQLMPEELEGYGVRRPFDPEENIKGGVQQLAEKLKRYNGDLERTLAAYNAGSGNVRKYNGVPPFPETQNYIKKIFSLLGRER